MKKILFTSAAVLMIGLTAVAQDTRFIKKGNGKWSPMPGIKNNTRHKKAGSNEWTFGLKCCNHNATCAGKDNTIVQTKNRKTASTK